MKEYLKADFEIPEYDQLFSGTLHLGKKRIYFILNENPFGHFFWNTIKIAYALTSYKQYTCINCQPFRYQNNQFYFEISEFYEGVILDKADIPLLNGCEAVISFLTPWLNPRLMHTEINPKYNPELLANVEVNPNKLYKIDINENISLSFNAYTKISHTKSEININSNSTINLYCKDLISRAELFSFYYSFLIFFTVFLRKIPRTYSLTYFSDQGDLELVLTVVKQKENINDILIGFRDINNYEVIVRNYFYQMEEYNLIVQLWQKSLLFNDPKITFLHLTQALELYHKTFCADDPQVLSSVAKSVKDSRLSKMLYKEWKQIMIYYHLYEVVKTNKLSISFPDTQINFLKKLRNTRNYYTHYHKNPESTVWLHHELYTINSILKIWVRSLILKNLNLDNDLIQKAINREEGAINNIDIFENEYSMRFKNYFTL